MPLLSKVIFGKEKLNLQRFDESQDLHFVTFSCSRRHPYLGTVRARNRFVTILDEVRSQHGFALIGYVVVPGHVHLLIGNLAKEILPKFSRF
jgi:putative transposase